MATVRRKAVDREGNEQQTLVGWANVHDLSQYNLVNVCTGTTLKGKVGHYLYAIVNETKHVALSPMKARNIGIKSKRMGKKKGVSDLHLPIPVSAADEPLLRYSGLWIEMKAPRKHKPKVSDEQLDWLAQMASVGHATAICYGMDAARYVIQQYLSGKHGVIEDGERRSDIEYVTGARL